MNDITHLSNSDQRPTERLPDAAAHLRQIADDLEAGKIRGCAVVAVYSTLRFRWHHTLPDTAVDGYALAGMLTRVAEDVVDHTRGCDEP